MKEEPEFTLGWLDSNHPIFRQGTIVMPVSGEYLKEIRKAKAKAKSTEAESTEGTLKPKRTKAKKT